MSKRFRTAKRRRQALADGKPCPYCGRTMSIKCKSHDPQFPTREHLIAGAHSPTIMVCRECNGRRGALPLEYWVMQLPDDRRLAVRDAILEIEEARVSGQAQAALEHARRIV